ncbi:MAG: D-hexose-6-phosphate mutarotase [Phycisphaera sp.]|nr:D-hexose-6-phosphate mutarotase [Phycisphaera sp.]
MVNLPSGVRLERSDIGHEYLNVATDAAEATVYLQGAHVAHFQPVGEQPVLFMSSMGLPQPGKAIRGGVPVCFPWFSSHKTDPSMPMHGLVRQRNWQLDWADRDELGRIVLGLSISWDESMFTAFPGRFKLSLNITVGREMELALTALNTDNRAWTFEEALHTYFHVGDIQKVSVEGLAGVGYSDKVDNFAKKIQNDQPIEFTGQTDRVYHQTAATCVVHDRVLNRKIEIAKQHSLTTVVWNPWIEKAKAMDDFGDDDWRRMVCVETANTHEQAVTLQPGESHTMTLGVRVM